MQRPTYTSEDFQTITAKIRYDLTAAQAKLTDLTRMIATLDLPTQDRPFNETRARTFIHNVGYAYTDDAIREELTWMKANDQQIDQLLKLAAKRRLEVAA